MTVEEDEPGQVIHATKLPSRLPPELLHIHPAADGVVATDPLRSGWRYLSFRAFGLLDGEAVLLDSTRPGSRDRDDLGRRRRHLGRRPAGPDPRT